MAAEDDILENKVESVDTFNSFMGPGISYMILDYLMKELLKASKGEDKEISSKYNYWVYLFLFSGLAFSIGSYSKTIYKLRHGQNTKMFARIAWWMSIFVSLANAAVVLSCLYAYIFIDNKAIMTGLITY